MPTPCDAEVCWRSLSQTYEETSTSTQRDAVPQRQTSSGPRNSITSLEYLTWLQHWIQAHSIQPRLRSPVFTHSNKVWNGDIAMAEWENASTTHFFKTQELNFYYVRPPWLFQSWFTKEDSWKSDLWYLGWTISCWFTIWDHLKSHSWEE